MIDNKCLIVKFSEGLDIFDNHYDYPKIDINENYNGPTGKVIDIQGIQAYAGHNFFVPEGKRFEIKIDECPYLQIAIKAEKNVSTCLFLMVHDKKPHDHVKRFIVIGKTPKGNPGYYDIGKECFTIKDDYIWHKYDYDLRKIRERDSFPKAESIHEIQFYTCIGTGKHIFHFTHLSCTASEDPVPNDMKKKLKFNINKEKLPIDSINEVRRLASSIIEISNSDEELALHAAANPIMAMEDMGYRFTDEIRYQLERIFRFSNETRMQLDNLEKEIHKIAGRSFNIDSSTELPHLLFDELNLPKPLFTIKSQIHQSYRVTPSELPTQPLPPQMSWTPKVKDPLEELRGVHTIMEPLLAYRQLEASEPRLATRDIYDKIKSGEVKFPLTKIKFRIIRDPTRE